MVRDNESDDCPSSDYVPGQAAGKCWGDGHYLCKECIYYREDFKRNGQEYIDFVHAQQIGIHLIQIT